MRTAIAVVCLASTVAWIPAQCTNPWVTFGPMCGVGGPISAAVAWDPDGAGPLPERLVVGGDFATAGSVPARNIAAWDPATGAWSALGSGCNRSVWALAALPNGRLVASGMFFDAGGVPAHRIAQWDGVAWSPLGSGTTSGYPRALAVMPNGDLIAGGAFSDMGGVPANGVARWNGSSWAAIGSGPTLSSVMALAVLPNGDLIAGGMGPGTGFDNLARWNGTTWSTFGIATGGSASVQALAVASNGDLIVGGSFASIGGVSANNVARWDGANWAALGSGTAGVRALCALPNGDVVVAGGVQVTRWNGSVWASLGAGMRGPTHRYPSPLWPSTADLRALATLANGELIAAGNFSVAGTASAQHVARWSGTQWSALSTGPGVDGIEDFAPLPGGDVVAVGNFAAAGSLVTNAVARWNGVAWSTLGSGGTNDGGVAHAITRLPNGDLIVGGAFASIGGVSSNDVARWDGSQWSPLGTLAAGGEVRSLAVAPNGTLFAGGYFYLSPGLGTELAAWNGTAWTRIAGAPTDIYTLTVLADGRLLAGGWLGCVAIWDGVAWTPLGMLQDDVYALAELPNGDIVAGGRYGLGSGQVQRWNGVAWSRLGGLFGGPVEDLHVLPNGDLLAGGWFQSTYPASGLARWDGTTWSPVGAGVDLGGAVWALTDTPDGDVWVGGRFGAAGGAPSGGFARLTTTCAARVQTLGAGCDGDTLTATLPWTGSTWRSDASGLPAAALVAVVGGFGTVSVPLSTLVATALPGCTLRVRSDSVFVMVAAGGTASAQFALPNAPALAGVVFHHQMLSLDLGPTMAVTATNALSLTLGAF